MLSILYNMDVLANRDVLQFFEFLLKLVFMLGLSSNLRKCFKKQSLDTLSMNYNNNASYAQKDYDIVRNFRLQGCDSNQMLLFEFRKKWNRYKIHKRYRQTCGRQDNQMATCADLEIMQNQKVILFSNNRSDISISCKNNNGLNDVTSGVFHDVDVLDLDAHLSKDIKKRRETRLRRDRPWKNPTTQLSRDWERRHENSSMKVLEVLRTSPFSSAKPHNNVHIGTHVCSPSQPNQLPRPSLDRQVKQTEGFLLKRTAKDNSLGCQRGPEALKKRQRVMGFALPNRSSEPKVIPFSSKITENIVAKTISAGGITPKGVTQNVKVSSNDSNVLVRTNKKEMKPGMHKATNVNCVSSNKRKPISVVDSDDDTMFYTVPSLDQSSETHSGDIHPHGKEFHLHAQSEREKTTFRTKRQTKHNGSGPIFSLNKLTEMTKPRYLGNDLKKPKSRDKALVMPGLERKVEAIVKSYMNFLAKDLEQLTYSEMEIGRDPNISDQSGCSAARFDHRKLLKEDGLDTSSDISSVCHTFSSQWTALNSKGNTCKNKSTFQSKLDSFMFNDCEVNADNKATSRSEISGNKPSRIPIPLKYVKSKFHNEKNSSGIMSPAQSFLKPPCPKRKNDENDCLPRKSFQATPAQQNKPNNTDQIKREQRLLRHVDSMEPGTEGNVDDGMNVNSLITILKDNKNITAEDNLNHFYQNSEMGHHIPSENNDFNPKLFKPGVVPFIQLSEAPSQVNRGLTFVKSPVLDQKSFHTVESAASDIKNIEKKNIKTSSTSDGNTSTSSWHSTTSNYKDAFLVHAQCPFKKAKLGEINPRGHFTSMSNDSDDDRCSISSGRDMESSSFTMKSIPDLPYICPSALSETLPTSGEVSPVNCEYIANSNGNQDTSKDTKLRLSLKTSSDSCLPAQKNSFGSSNMDLQTSFGMYSLPSSPIASNLEQNQNSYKSNEQMNSSPYASGSNKVAQDKQNRPQRGNLQALEGINQSHNKTPKGIPLMSFLRKIKQSRRSSVEKKSGIKYRDIQLRRFHRFKHHDRCSYDAALRCGSDNTISPPLFKKLLDFWENRSSKSINSSKSSSSHKINRVSKYHKSPLKAARKYTENTEGKRKMPTLDRNIRQSYTSSDRPCSNSTSFFSMSQSEANVPLRRFDIKINKTPGSSDPRIKRPLLNDVNGVQGYNCERLSRSGSSTTPALCVVPPRIKGNTTAPARNTTIPPQTETTNSGGSVCVDELSFSSLPTINPTNNNTQAHFKEQNLNTNDGMGLEPATFNRQNQNMSSVDTRYFSDQSIAAPSLETCRRPYSTHHLVMGKYQQIVHFLNSTHNQARRPDSIGDLTFSFSDGQESVGLNKRANKKLCFSNPSMRKGLYLRNKCSGPKLSKKQEFLGSNADVKKHKFPTPKVGKSPTTLPRFRPLDFSPDGTTTSTATLNTSASTTSRTFEISNGLGLKELEITLEDFNIQKDKSAKQTKLRKQKTRNQRARHGQTNFKPRISPIYCTRDENDMRQARDKRAEYDQNLKLFKKQSDIRTNARGETTTDHLEATVKGTKSQSTSYTSTADEHTDVNSFSDEQDTTPDIFYVLSTGLDCTPGSEETNPTDILLDTQSALKTSRGKFHREMSSPEENTRYIGFGNAENDQGKFFSPMDNHKAIDEKKNHNYLWNREKDVDWSLFGNLNNTENKQNNDRTSYEKRKRLKFKPLSWNSTVIGSGDSECFPELSENKNKTEIQLIGKHHLRNATQIDKEKHIQRQCNNQMDGIVQKGQMLRERKTRETPEQFTSMIKSNRKVIHTPYISKCKNYKREIKCARKKATKSPREYFLNTTNRTYTCSPNHNTVNNPRYKNMNAVQLTGENSPKQNIASILRKKLSYSQKSNAPSTDRLSCISKSPEGVNKTFADEIDNQVLTTPKVSPKIVHHYKSSICSRTFSVKPGKRLKDIAVQCHGSPPSVKCQQITPIQIAPTDGQHLDCVVNDQGNTAVPVLYDACKQLPDRGAFQSMRSEKNICDNVKGLIKYQNESLMPLKYLIQNTTDSKSKSVHTSKPFGNKLKDQPSSQQEPQQTKGIISLDTLLKSKGLENKSPKPIKQQPDYTRPFQSKKPITPQSFQSIKKLIYDEKMNNLHHPRSKVFSKSAGSSPYHPLTNVPMQDSRPSETTKPTRFFKNLPVVDIFREIYLRKGQETSSLAQSSNAQTSQIATSKSKTSLTELSPTSSSKTQYSKLEISQKLNRGIPSSEFTNSNEKLTEGISTKLFVGSQPVGLANKCKTVSRSESFPSLYRPPKGITMFRLKPTMQNCEDKNKINTLKHDISRLFSDVILFSKQSGSSNMSRSSKLFGQTTSSLFPSVTMSCTHISSLPATIKDTTKSFSTSNVCRSSKTYRESTNTLNDLISQLYIFAKQIPETNSSRESSVIGTIDQLDLTKLTKLLMLNRNISRNAKSGRCKSSYLRNINLASLLQFKNTKTVKIKESVFESKEDTNENTLEGVSEVPNKLVLAEQDKKYEKNQEEISVRKQDQHKQQDQLINDNQNLLRRDKLLLVDGKVQDLTIPVGNTESVTSGGICNIKDGVHDIEIVLGENVPVADVLNCIMGKLKHKNNNSSVNKQNSDTSEALEKKIRKMIHEIYGDTTLNRKISTDASQFTNKHPDFKQKKQKQQGEKNDKKHLSNMVSRSLLAGNHDNQPMDTETSGSNSAVMKSKSNTLSAWLGREDRGYRHATKSKLRVKRSPGGLNIPKVGIVQSVKRSQEKKRKATHCRLRSNGEDQVKQTDSNTRMYHQHGPGVTTIARIDTTMDPESKATLSGWVDSYGKSRFHGNTGHLYNKSILRHSLGKKRNAGYGIKSRPPCPSSPRLNILDTSGHTKGTKMKKEKSRELRQEKVDTFTISKPVSTHLQKISKCEDTMLVKCKEDRIGKQTSSKKGQLTNHRSVYSKAQYIVDKIIAHKPSTSLVSAPFKNQGSLLDLSDNKPETDDIDLPLNINRSHGIEDETDQLAKVIASILKSNKSESEKYQSLFQRVSSNRQNQTINETPVKDHYTDPSVGAEKKSDLTKDMKNTDMLKLIHGTVQTQINSGILPLNKEDRQTPDNSLVKAPLDKTDNYTSSWSEQTTDNQRSRIKQVNKKTYANLTKSSDSIETMKSAANKSVMKTQENASDFNVVTKQPHIIRQKDFLAMRAPVTISTPDNAVRFSLCHKTKGDQDIKCVKLSLTQNGSDETDIFVEPDSSHQELSPTIKAKHGVVKVLYGSDSKNSDRTSSNSKTTRDNSITRIMTANHHDKEIDNKYNENDVYEPVILKKCKDFDCFIDEQLSSRKVRCRQTQTSRTKEVKIQSKDPQSDLEKTKRISRCPQSNKHSETQACRSIDDGLRKKRIDRNSHDTSELSFENSIVYKNVCNRIARESVSGHITEQKVCKCQKSPSDIDTESDVTEYVSLDEDHNYPKPNKCKPTISKTSKKDCQHGKCMRKDLLKKSELKRELVGHNYDLRNMERNIVSNGEKANNLGQGDGDCNPLMQNHVGLIQAGPMISANTHTNIDKQKDNAVILESLNRLHTRLDNISNQAPVTVSHVRSPFQEMLGDGFASNRELRSNPIDVQGQGETKYENQNLVFEGQQSTTNSHVEIPKTTRKNIFSNDRFNDGNQNIAKERISKTPIHYFSSTATKQPRSSFINGDFVSTKPQTSNQRTIYQKPNVPNEFTKEIQISPYTQPSHFRFEREAIDLLRTNQPNYVDANFYQDKNNVLNKMRSYHDENMLRSSAPSSPNRYTGKTTRFGGDNESLQLVKGRELSENFARYDRDVYTFENSKAMNGPLPLEDEEEDYRSRLGRKRGISSSYLDVSHFEAPTRYSPSRHTSSLHTQTRRTPTRQTHSHIPSHDTEMSTLSSPTDLAYKRLEKPSFYSHIQQKLEEARNARQQRSLLTNSKSEDQSDFWKIKYPSHYEPFFHKSNILKANHENVNDQPTKDRPWNRRYDKNPVTNPSPQRQRRNNVELLSHDVSYIDKLVDNRISMAEQRKQRERESALAGNLENTLISQPSENTLQTRMSFRNRLEELRNMELPPTPNSVVTNSLIKRPPVISHSLNTFRDTTSIANLQQEKDKAFEQTGRQAALLTPENISQIKSFQNENKPDALLTSPTQSLSPTSKGILMSPNKYKEKISPRRKVSFAESVKSVNDLRPRQMPGDNSKMDTNATNPKSGQRQSFLSQYRPMVPISLGEATDSRYPSSYSELRYQARGSTTPLSAGEMALRGARRNLFSKSLSDGTFKPGAQQAAVTPEQPAKPDPAADDWDATVLNRLQQRSTVPLASSMNSRKMLPPFNRQRWT